MGRYVTLEIIVDPPLGEEDTALLFTAFRWGDYDFPAGCLPKALGGLWRKPSLSLFEVLDFIDLYTNEGRKIRGITRDVEDERYSRDQQGDRSSPYAYDSIWYPSLPWDQGSHYLRDAQAMLRGMILDTVQERAGVLTREMGDRFSRMVGVIFGPKTHQKYLSLTLNHGEWWEIEDGDELTSVLSTPT